MELRKMNLLISDFLRDLYTVFPDSYELAQAKRLVDSAVALDHSGPIPVFFFLSGHDIPKAPEGGGPQDPASAASTTGLMEFPRPMLGLTADAWDSLYKSCSESNQDIIKRYLAVIERNIAGFATCTLDIAERQKDMIKTDCFIQLKKLTSDPKYCDEFLNDTDKMESLVDRIINTAGFADIRDGAMFVVNRVMASPELLMKLAASAGEIFSGDDDDSDDTDGGLGGALAAIGGLAGLGGGESLGMISSIQGLLEGAGGATGEDTQKPGTKGDKSHVE